MACTTILVGRKASYDGSTLIARNDDSPSGIFMPKKMIVVSPDKQPKHYHSRLSHLELDLPENPLQYTCTPNVPEDEGIWAASGVNSLNVAMTATETITSNPRVLGADPLLGKSEKNGEKRYNGLGEEDIVALVLPYIRSAREGVLRLGQLLTEYGTYESNGIAFSDKNEIWWLETIGGHHFIAKRVPDDSYVAMPNAFGLDRFDFADAFGEQKEHICSSDLKVFIEENHLDLSFSESFNPRVAFGSHSDSDHVYNTPRAWYIERYLSGKKRFFDGPNAEFTPLSDDIPWCDTPDRKITLEDIKYLLSSHYQGTPFDPYSKNHEPYWKAPFRPIGISRTDDLSLIQIRPYRDDKIAAIQWIGFGSNMYNELLPIYTNAEDIPAYLSKTSRTPDTSFYYWNIRLIGALADPYFATTEIFVERFQEEVASKGHALVRLNDEAILKGKSIEEANQEVADMAKEATERLLSQVLHEASMHMKNGFSRSDH